MLFVVFYRLCINGEIKLELYRFAHSIYMVKYEVYVFMCKKFYLLKVKDL